MMRKCSIIKNVENKSIITEKKRISISPTLIYIDNNIRKSNNNSFKNNYKVNEYNNDNDDSDFEYY